MPIYEYQCKNCDKISEFLVGVTQGKIEIECKYCGSKKLNKIFSKSFISTGKHFINSYGGQICCGRTERCDIPLCSDDGACKR